VGLPGALVGELVQELGELLTRNDALNAVLRELLKRRADLLADRRMCRHMVGKLMQGRGNLLLLLCGDLLGLAQLVAESLLAADAKPDIAEVWITNPEAADLATDLRARSLQASITAHHCSGCPEEGGCQRLSEKRGVVSVRHDILHWPSSD
jgi:hypothetical protein